MELQSEETASRHDTAFLLAAVVLLLGGMVAFYGLDPQLSKLPRLVILLAGTGAAVALVWRTALGGSIMAYLTGARTEMRKVVWPTRQESIQTTLVIAVFVLIVALIMWGLDSLLLLGVQSLTGRGA